MLVNGYFTPFFRDRTLTLLTQISKDRPNPSFPFTTPVDFHLRKKKNIFLVAFGTPNCSTLPFCLLLLNNSGKRNSAIRIYRCVICKKTAVREKTSCREGIQVWLRHKMGMAKDDMEVFDSLTKYEDFAWVDSCLVEDPIIPPPGEWSCMKDALLEILGSESDTPSVLVDDNVIPLCKKSEPGHRFKDKDDNDIYFCEEGENSQTMQHDDDQDEEAADVKDDGDYDTVWYKSAKAKERIRKALRETSRDNFFAANSGSRSGLGLLPTKKEMDTPSDDIFKVWDLGINVEEDEFSKQMNKLIADNGDDSYLWERPDRVMNESVDSLVYGIADLSLEQA